jgi:hypothetical protein
MRVHDRRQAGLAHFNAGRLGLAETSLRAAAAAAPRDAAIQHDLGQVLRARGRLAPAARAFEAAIAAAPDMAAAHLALGAVRQRLEGDAVAEPCVRRAAELAPAAPAVHVALGDILRGLGRLAEARAAYETALRLSPNDGPARFGRGFLNLLQGDFAAGWPDYEFRSSRRGPPPPALTPQWRGEDPAGKTLLLYAEQGLGDTLQFLRYAAPLAAAGARVLAAVPTPLIEMAARAQGVHAVVEPTRALPPFDACCPLPSLPLRMNARLDTIPAPDGYLTAPPERVARWGARLGPSGSFTVAVAWAGARGHPNDHNRSADIADLAPLFQVPGVRWLNLQAGPDADALRSRRGGPEIVGLSGAIRDFADTAAILMSADLVVCVDTALCHLAGALGRPVWILLPFAPDWRWLLDREDSPWYASARLYRQSRPRDWAGTVLQVARDLRREADLH